MSNPLSLIKSRRFKIFYYTVGVLLIIVFFGYHLKHDRERDRQFMIRFKAESYCGIIDQKYIDTVNHYNETIEILTASGQKVIICDLDNSGLYRYCQVGDSIVKQPDTYIIDVYRDGDGKASFEIFINLLD